MRFTTSREMREIDRRAIEEFGMPGVILMENAGRGAASVALDILDGKPGARVTIVCGRGNNGGDGFVIARHLNNARVRVKIYLLAERSQIAGDALINLNIVEKMKLDLRDALTERLDFSDADLVVDAMLGTGLSGEVREPFAGAINAVNASGKPVLAVDVPSGLDADTGKALGVCVRANRTVTFALPKIGFTRELGPQITGEVVVADTGVPRELLGQ